jgi:hypothetical protein
MKNKQIKMGVKGSSGMLYILQIPQTMDSVQQNWGVIYQLLILWLMTPIMYYLTFLASVHHRNEVVSF